MNPKFIDRCGLPVIAALGLLLSNIALAAPGAQVTLEGQNDPAVDRAAIQAAIDSAPGKRLTIKLSGTFQLDGQDLIVDRSDIVIKGFRSGATLLGKLGPEGLPVEDIDNFPNRGFLIESVNPLTNIEIKDLSLSGFRSPVLIRGRQNTISDVRVKNNIVENSFFAVSAVGTVSDILIANNTAMGVSIDGVTVFATPEGRPMNIRIVDNHVSEAGADGISIFDVSNVIIANNFLSTSASEVTATPFLADGTNSNILFESNTTEGGVIGVLLLGDSSDFLVTKNCIRNGGTDGLSFLRGGGIQVGVSVFGLTGSGFDIADNSYSSNFAGDPPVARDIWLNSGSSNTSVIERDGVIVVDEGASNSVSILEDDGVDHCYD